MKIKLIVSALMLFVSVGLFAQDNYHRLFNIEDGINLINLDATRLDDGGYGLIATRITEDGLRFGSLIYTNMDIKGDISSSMEIYLDIDSIDVVNSADIINMGNDQLIVSAVILDEGRANKVLISMNSAGDVSWSKSYSSGVDDTESLGSSELEQYRPNSFLHSGLARDAENIETYLAEVDRDGEFLWAQNMVPSDSVGNFYVAQCDDIVVLNDTSDFIISGLLDTLLPKPFIAVLDTVGDPVWSRMYLPDSEDYVSYSRSLVKLTDGSYVMGGTIQDNVNQFVNGFVTKTDISGQVEWTRRISFPGILTFSAIDNVMEMNDGGIMASGNYLEIDQNFQIEDVTPFIMKFDLDGNVEWQHEYNSEVFGSFNDQGTLLPTDLGGAYFTTGIKDFNVGGTFQELIKVDDNGNTMCQDTIEDEIAIEYLMTSDTLTWTKTEVGVSNDLVIDANTFDEYNVKILSLEGYTFCPNEVIDTFLVATVGGASYYEWSTGLEGPDADTLFVTDVGTFEVTVTMAEEVCYTLCDTTMFDRYELPQVLMRQTKGTFCEDGTVLLSADYTPGHPSTPNYVWSTGDQGNVTFIKVSELGSYSVTLTDACGEMAEGQIDVTAFPQLITTASADFTPNCDGDGMFISLSATADGDIISVNWTGPQNGSGNPFIVSEPGEYTATVIDCCDNEFTATVNAEYPVDIIGLSIANLDDYCDDESITLRLEVESGTLGDVNDITWNTNESTQLITVSNPGTYSVTVEDNCGFLTDASITLTDEDFPGILGPIEVLNTCVGKDQRLEVAFSNQTIPASYSWSTGSSEPSITVSQDGTYSVTVTNICGSQSASANIIIDDCGCLRYPKVFFPQGQEDMNRTFGPVNECPEEVENYDLKIFNRWGQLVFETTEVAEEWNGLFNEDPSASGVYIFYAKYFIGGEEYPMIEGDVTLFR